MVQGFLTALMGPEAGAGQALTLDPDALSREPDLLGRRRWRALTQIIGIGPALTGPRDQRELGGQHAKLGLLALHAARLRADGRAPDGAAAAAYACVLATNLPIRAVLLAAAAALREAGVPAIVYKGQDYLDRIYGDLGARPMADADLLVRCDDRARAAGALCAAGFVADAACHTEHERKFYKDGVAIDLHHRLLQVGRTAVDHDALFARAASSPLGEGLLQLEATDALLVHCVAQMNKGCALVASSYVELHALMANADLGAVITRARAYSVASALYVSMRALAALGDRRAHAVAESLGLGANRRLVLDQLVAFARRQTATPPPRRATLLLIKAMLVDDGGARVSSLPRWLWAQVGPPLDEHQLS